MLVRKIIPLFVTAVLLIGSTGCSDKVKEAEKQKVNDHKIELKLYTQNQDVLTSAALVKYNESHKDSSIKVTSFEDYEQFRNRLTTELMSGQGPDIIMDMGNSFVSSFNSIYKTMESGVLEDLNGLIASDKSFNMADYNEKVMECGVYKGKRYFVPLSFRADIMTTTKDIMKKNGIKIDTENWTWNDLTQVAREYNPKVKDRARYLFAGWMIRVEQLLKNSGVDFVDFENKKTSFNSPEFIDMLKTFKRDINRAICPENELGYTGDDLLTYDVAVMINNIGAINGGPFEAYRLSARSLGQGTDFVAFPTYSAKKSVQVIEPVTVSINAKSIYKKEAFEYIKLLLSEELQQRRDDFYQIIIPVNKKVYEDSKKQAALSKGVDKEQVDKIDRIINRAERYEVWDYEVYMILLEHINQFVSGGKSPEQIAKSLDREVTDYMNQ
ncbi:MAG: extracellular solute-binding protein [Clostridia bacterium]|nr:extracellular solute-binding protein [Clostridia bacterium]